MLPARLEKIGINRPNTSGSLNRRASMIHADLRRRTMLAIRRSGAPPTEKRGRVDRRGARLGREQGKEASQRATAEAQ
jgi:hypothetical protein